MDKKLFFDDWDQYCFFMNPKNGFALLTKDEYGQMLDHMKDDEACYEIDSDYAYERRMHNMVADWEK